MARLTVLVGAPGSGKSTYADKAGRGEVVSTHGARVDPGSGGEVMRGCYRRLHELLESGQDAVFDTTGASTNIRKAAINIARKYGAEAHALVFDPPVEACVEAQRNRAHPVPEEDVRRYHANIRRQLPMLEREGFVSVRRVR